MKKNNTSSLYLIFIFIIVILTLPFGKAEGGTMELTSSAFNESGMIPGKYTCDGADVSPPLKWGSLPDGTKSLVLICDDPDAPVGTWVHWVYYDIPVHTKDLPENVAPDVQHPVEFRGPMIFAESVTAALARREVLTGIFSNYTPSTLC